jgi:hypothetical protein
MDTKAPRRAAQYIHTKPAAARCGGALDARGRAISGLKVLLRASPNPEAACEALIDQARVRQARLRVSSVHAGASCRRAPASTKMAAARRHVVDAPSSHDPR